MARKKKFDGGSSSLEYTREYLREKGLKALKQAKEKEQNEINNGYHWVIEGKTRRLVKNN